MEQKRVAILCGGGSSSEREISIRSGRAAYEALKFQIETAIFELTEDALPEEIDSSRDIILPLGHGEFMEDGGLQTLLEAENFSYAGSDAVASRLCMDKIAVKKIAESLGIITPKYCVYEGQNFETLWKIFGGPFVIKPDNKGSSVDVYKIYNQKEFQEHADLLKKGYWLIERCIEGKELTVGVLVRRALPVIEIHAKEGFYDYHNKYTAGATEYRVPAPISDQSTVQAKKIAEKIFEACKCRDFGRVDCMMDHQGKLYLLEVNTIPGMTATSLLPKAAAAEGISFEQLCLKMVRFAFDRAPSTLKFDGVQNKTTEIVTDVFTEVIE